MCTNQRWITNRYTGNKIYVKCGHCKACLQEKANRRAQRIKNEFTSDRIILFVGLTYDRDSCPYILESDLHSRKQVLPVYRAYRLVRAYDKLNKRFYRKRIYEPEELTQLINPNYEQIGKLRSLAYRWNKFGVCYYPDVQQFEKNLRHHLQRDHGFYEKFKIYKCSEYGERSFRPHFHLCIFIRPSDEEKFTRSICKAWPFADIQRAQCNSDLRRRPIQVADKDPARYVASYVNRGSDFPSFLANNFPPKYSASKYFGHGNKCFVLDEILKKIDTGTLEFARLKCINGIPSIVDIPVPKYVVNRFFPLFKGYSRLSRSAVRDILYDPEQLYYKTTSVNVDGFPDRYLLSPVIENGRRSVPVDYTLEQMYRIKVRLDNAFKEYNRLTGRNRLQYALDHVAAWNAVSNTRLKWFYKSTDDIPLFEQWDNIAEGVQLMRSRRLPPDSYHANILRVANEQGVQLEYDPNKFSSVVSSSLKMIELYDNMCKKKSINNFVQMRECGTHKRDGLV